MTREAATEKLLKRSGVALGEIGVFEVNEAFARTANATLLELAGE